MKLEAICPPDAPAPIAPYSPGVLSRAGGPLLFISGQIAIDPSTQQFAGGSVADQTRLALANLRAVLLAAGGDMHNVAKTTIYLRDMDDFPLVNEVYGTAFQAPYPARATVQVARLPRDAAVEIDAMAVLP